jgi:NAD(P)-dependent dehydrogenase (short-subunit alcohol dehydrogenase family)
MTMSGHIRKLYDLTGKIAIVTGGAGQGYGHQCVEALGEAGARVVLTSRDADRARAAAAGFKEAGLDVEGAQLELTDSDSIDSLVHETNDRHGRIDVLVNSAARNVLASVDTVTLEQWDSVLAVNLTGTMLMSRRVATVMRREGGPGSVICISSIYGVVAPDPSIYGTSGLNSPLAYGVSKAGLIQMTKYLAVEWAPQIRVNCITAGGLQAGQDAAFVEGYSRRTPLQRMAGPTDLKGAVVFLASGASRWVTGHNLIVDGGWTIW